MASALTDEFLTIEELAGSLKVGRASIDRMVDDGRLPKPMVISKRIRRWRRSEVEKYLDLDAEPAPAAKQGRQAKRLKDIKW